MNIKIYDINYLISEELTDDDLHYLFDTLSFKISIIVGMFKYVKSNLSNDKIVKLCTENSDWVYKNFWTKRQRNNFEKQVSLIYKNVYQYSDMKSCQNAEWFLCQYGFSVLN